LPKAQEFAPDLALIAVGANDATKFTSARDMENSMQAIINGLRQSNKDVKIIVTGSPAMDSVTRFPFISKWVMKIRTKQINDVFDSLIEKNVLTHAPIALETRQAFLDDPTLTAADNFHPNARGYALWIPVINKAVDSALK
ncbi:MAG: GDSL-type esterase/lipase family protein, partial [Candidatus Saccharimonadales bacterium]